MASDTYYCAASDSYILQAEELGIHPRIALKKGGKTSQESFEESCTDIAEPGSDKQPRVAEEGGNKGLGQREGGEETLQEEGKEPVAAVIVHV